MYEREVIPPHRPRLPPPPVTLLRCLPPPQPQHSLRLPTPLPPFHTYRSRVSGRLWLALMQSATRWASSSASGTTRCGAHGGGLPYLPHLEQLGVRLTGRGGIPFHIFHTFRPSPPSTLTHTQAGRVAGLQREADESELRGEAGGGEGAGACTITGWRTSDKPPSWMPPPPSPLLLPPPISDALLGCPFSALPPSPFSLSLLSPSPAGTLIEYNLEAVDAVLLAVNEALASGEGGGHLPWVVQEERNAPIDIVGWHAGCLHHHQHPRFTQTLNPAQVRTLTAALLSSPHLHFSP